MTGGTDFRYRDPVGWHEYVAAGGRALWGRDGHRAAERARGGFEFDRRGRGRDKLGPATVETDDIRKGRGAEVRSRHRHFLAGCCDGGRDRGDARRGGAKDREVFGAG